MTPSTYQSIVAKRPELEVVVPNGLRLCTKPDAPHDRVWFLYDGGVFEHWGEDNERMMAYTHALIFKHWTEMLPDGHSVAKAFGGDYAIMQYDDNGFWTCKKPWLDNQTPLDALAEFWRTYEGC